MSLYLAWMCFTRHVFNEMQSCRWWPEAKTAWKIPHKRSRFFSSILKYIETPVWFETLAYTMANLSIRWNRSQEGVSIQWSVCVLLEASVVSWLPREAIQSQHSLGIGLSSLRFSSPQQDKQRPSSDRIWSAGHTVQFHMLGPLQSTQDGSHALQIASSLLSWSNKRVWYRYCSRLTDPCQTARALIWHSSIHQAKTL